VHCWVIGPGLGRDPYMHEFFPLLIKNIAKDKIIIFDADGIYYLAQHP
jgi:NAD(P)H-hydrate repair Nnr-like enzyme with NAD(P)H-hydrate dehydratase domain